MKNKFHWVWKLKNMTNETFLSISKVICINALDLLKTLWSHFLHNKNVLDAEIKHSEFCISSTTEHFLWFSSFILQMFCVTVVSYDWQILWRWWWRRCPNPLTDVQKNYHSISGVISLISFTCFSTPWGILLESF